MTTDSIQTLITGVLNSDRRAVARAISLVENSTEGASDILSAIHPRVGQAARLGFTGPPGAGKSTLVGAMAGVYRRTSDRVGIVAVDPTSPFSGGALLGDRVRMTRHSTDPGVFIRSMASRGVFGGLSRGTWDAVDILDASGCNPVLIETVGVGQTELEIAGLADTTLVVFSPEAGDNVQAMKAGLMEIADVFIVNKADRDGADALTRDIETMLDYKSSSRASDGDWRPPVLKAIAARGEGADEIKEAILVHAAHLSEHGLLEERRRAAIRRRVLDILESRIRRRFWTAEMKTELKRQVDRVYQRDENPAGAADLLLAAGTLFDRTDDPSVG